MPSPREVLYAQLDEIDSVVMGFLRQLHKDEKEWMDKLWAQVEIVKNTGDGSGLRDLLNSNTPNTYRSMFDMGELDEFKNAPESVHPKPKDFDEANELLNQPTNMKKHDDAEAALKIKMERVSTITSDTNENIDVFNLPTVKEEVINEMLPPKIPAKRGRKKKETIVKTEPRTSTCKTKDDGHRNSDVIMEVNEVPVISLDSDGEIAEEIKLKPSSTGTKMKTMKIVDPNICSNDLDEKLESARAKNKPAEIDVRRESARTNKLKKKYVYDSSEDDESLANIRTIETNKKQTNEVVIEETRASTRTKKNKLKAESAKRLRSPSVEPIKKSKNKRTKRKISQEIIKDARKLSESTQNGDDDTVYEDAITSTINHDLYTNVQVVIERCEELHNPNIPKQVMNETIIISKKTSAIMNETVVIEKPQVNQKTQANLNETVVIEAAVHLEDDVDVMKDFMTDDESIEEPVVPKKTKAKLPKVAVFNAFENSPVKKKIQAFEKLQVDALDAPARMTRTKTKANKKAETIEDSSSTTSVSSGSAASQVSQIPVSSKVTPNTSKLNPMHFGSSGKFAMATSAISIKSASALKAARDEYREREVRRKEKEEQALRKRQALRAAQIEEKRVRREEKELKAKQVRDELEREHRNKVELQMAREERQKQLVLSEKVEKQQKLKEETEKRRLLAKQRYEEKENRRLHEERLRKKEDERIKAAASAVKKANLPIYMTQKAPLLPTFNCYDSDDPEAAQNTLEKPAWVRVDKVKESLHHMEAIDNKLQNTLFTMRAQTPDLSKIFQQLDPAKLKRNSSAIWKHAPRFTLMPIIDDDDDDI